MALAIAMALSVRIFYLVALQRAIDMADAIHYIQMAQQFASGDFLNFDENLPVAMRNIATLISRWCEGTPRPR